MSWAGSGQSVPHDGVKVAVAVPMSTEYGLVPGYLWHLSSTATPAVGMRKYVVDDDDVDELSGVDAVGERAAEAACLVGTAMIV